MAKIYDEIEDRTVSERTTLQEDLVSNLQVVCAITALLVRTFKKVTFKIAVELYNLGIYKEDENDHVDVSMLSVHVNVHGVAIDRGSNY